MFHSSSKFLAPSFGGPGFSPVVTALLRTGFTR
jgi:hypothetical protein